MVEIETFLGDWRDSLGNHVKVEWAKPGSRGGQLNVELSRPRSNRDPIRLDVKSVGRGRFACGHYDLDLDESNENRIVWLDVRNRGKNSVWTRQGSERRDRPDRPDRRGESRSGGPPPGGYFSSSGPPPGHGGSYGRLGGLPSPAAYWATAMPAAYGHPPGPPQHQEPPTPPRSAAASSGPTPGAWVPPSPSESVSIVPVGDTSSRGDTSSSHYNLGDSRTSVKQEVDDDEISALLALPEPPRAERRISQTAAVVVKPTPLVDELDDFDKMLLESEGVSDPAPATSLETGNFLQQIQEEEKRLQQEQEEKRLQEQQAKQQQQKQQKQRIPTSFVKEELIEEAMPALSVTTLSSPAAEASSADPRRRKDPRADPRADPRRSLPEPESLPEQPEMDLPLKPEVFVSQKEEIELPSLSIEVLQQPAPPPAPRPPAQVPAPAPQVAVPEVAALKKPKRKQALPQHPPQQQPPPPTQQPQQLQQPQQPQQPQQQFLAQGVTPVIPQSTISTPVTPMTPTTPMTPMMQTAHPTPQAPQVPQIQAPTVPAAPRVDEAQRRLAAYSALLLGDSSAPADAEEESEAPWKRQKRQRG
eukprot:TRINITY_DN6761_c0_g1_i3.p1 TRINITY_DN6761_c0_g1~~TRINITY_DN6761_c0_g1_i3.p1  ORF type:complete len:587 (-),score=147.52 TRINITY_DN6761_c0_g1_i3:273-2033(-)